MAMVVIVAKGMATPVQRVHLHQPSVSTGETWAATAATVFRNAADYAILVSAGDTSAVPGATAEETSVTWGVCYRSQRKVEG